jgi:hypothetical protein
LGLKERWGLHGTHLAFAFVPFMPSPLNSKHSQNANIGEDDLEVDHMYETMQPILQLQEVASFIAKLRTCGPKVTPSQETSLYPLLLSDFSHPSWPLMLAQKVLLAYIIKHVGLDLEEKLEGFVDAFDDQSTPSSPVVFVSFAITLDSIEACSFLPIFSIAVDRTMRSLQGIESILVGGGDCKEQLKAKKYLWHEVLYVKEDAIK